MSFPESFKTQMNVAIVGANGGIGSALLQQITNSKKVKRVFALSRKPVDIDGATFIKTDITEDSSIQNAAEQISKTGELDLIIIATGILYDDAKLFPEKRLGDIESENFEKIFQINTTGPALVMKYFAPLLERKHKAVIAALSARVGSISDNQLGGWYGYRASKAALNLIIKTTSIELARSHKQAAVVGLHPGTVDTALSAPFRSSVPEKQLFEPQFSAEKLLSVIDRLQASDTGKVFAWDGKEISY